MSVRIAAGGAAGEAITRAVPRLVDERVASGITAQYPDLWGPAASRGAGSRLGWTEAVADSRPLVAQVAALRARLLAAGVDRVVLCGAGGAAVAGQVIAATGGVLLDVLDTADPAAVAASTAEKPGSTAAVVLAERGTSLETDRWMTAFERAFRAAGVDPAERIVVVAEPGSAADSAARAAGRRVFSSQPGVVGGSSALTAFGLVPAGLAGADLGGLLDEAESELLDLAIDAPTNNALVLGAAIAAATPRRPILVVVADGTHLVGFGDWIVQVLGSATGARTGVLPVVVETGAPELEAASADVQVLRLVADALDDRHDRLLEAGEVLLSGSLGELLLVWEHAAAVAARLLGVDPFARDDVEALEARVPGLLAAQPRPVAEGLTVEPFGLGAALGSDAAGAVAALLAAAAPGGHASVVVHGDLALAGALVGRRAALAARVGRPVIVDRGPRSLHSTARYRLSGPIGGAHLVVIAGPDADGAAGPDVEGWADLARAQGTAEADAIAAAGGPVLVAHVAGAAGARALLAVIDA